MRIHFAVLCAFVSTAALAANDVRPLSYAERAAVQIAANYLSVGPPAVYDQLSTESPLRKLSKNDALDEIEVRFGPAAGATWELQTVVPALQDSTAVFNISYPSGSDETVVMNFEAQNGEFKVHDARILAEPSPTEPIFPPMTEASSVPVKKGNPNSLPIAAGIVAIVMAVSAMVTASQKAMTARLMIVVGIIAAGLGAFLAFNHLKAKQAEEAALQALTTEKESFPRLAKLLPFRRAVAAGTDVAAVMPPAALKGTAAEVAKLWKAQLDIEQMHTDHAKATLAREPNPSQTPLTEILRGRLAVTEAKETDSVIAYEHAVNLGPGRDGLWLEASQSLDNLGFSDRAELYLKRLAHIGSRDANVYYALATLAAFHNHEDDAVKALKTAWNLRPMPREQIVATPILWNIIRKPDVVTSIKLSAAAEATFASPQVSTRAIQLPSNAQPSVSGDFLHVQMGEASLDVPGGACLAPAGTPVVDAGVWSRILDQKAIADFPQLSLTARNAGAYTQPLLRRRILRTAESLAKHNRWADLVQMTEGLSARSEHVPADMFFYRAEALRRLDREQEARNQLVQLAGSPVLKRRNDPQQFVELGAMLAQLDEFDAAVKMLDHAAQLKKDYASGVDEFVAKISMNKRLATKYQTYKVPHFEIRFPEDVSQAFAAQMGDILEKELKREARWVSVANFKPVTVNVVWWRDFKSAYTGSDFILGFYQAGKLTIPFAGIPGWYPEITAIMSHELCHAIIAQATNDQAPHWFQEGLAQRVEMVQYKPNAFNMYDDDRLLSVSLLDGVLRGSPDPDMISEAYIVSQTIIRFIESAYGQKGIDTMIGAYRDGSTTEEAIQKVAGISVADFDAKLRAWGRGSTKVFENHDLIDYSRQVPDGNEMRWTGRSGGAR
jgi:tetratricopeptide (TPR) repeat protein